MDCYGDDLAIAFCANPLDRAEDRRGDADWLAAARRRGKFLGLHDGRVRILRSEGGPELGWLGVDEVDPTAECVLLGIDDAGRPCFALELSEARESATVGFSDARSLALDLAASGRDEGRSGIVAQARVILSWHRQHRFCAGCGQPTEVRRGGYQRWCEPCAREHYPRTDPVAIMLVHDRERCLLGRQANWPEGVYSALAGFVEAGESLEAAVRREVHEETGIRTGRVRYIGSQPWPFPSNLMLGFLAEAQSSTIRRDPAELSDARWFSRDEVRAMLAGRHDSFRAPAPIAIARHLLALWLDEAAGAVRNT